MSELNEPTSSEIQSLSPLFLLSDPVIAVSLTMGTESKFDTTNAPAAKSSD